MDTTLLFQNFKMAFGLHEHCAHGSSKANLDGHKWEPAYMNMSQLPNQ